MPREKKTPLNLVEVRDTKAAIYDLSESAAKQFLLGITQVLSIKNTVTKEQFLGVLDDARKYNTVIRNKGL